MVLIAFDHSDGAIHVGVGPVGIFGERFGVEAHSVALNIGFVDQINAVAITKIIPRRLIWIMTAAHRVYVETLHELNVLLHPLDGDGLAAVRVELMPIDSFDENPLSVYQQIALVNFNFAETNIDWNHFDGLARGVLQA